jgi:hypothetical protein
MLNVMRRLAVPSLALVAIAVITALALPSRRIPARIAARVQFLHVPDGGLQPQVTVDKQNRLHLIYFKGDPQHGDVFYVRSQNWGSTFSAPIRVNSQPGSAIAMGSIRGARIAIGKNGRVYVAWNGSTLASPKAPLNPAMPADSPYNGTPMLFTRLNNAGTAFEPQRNLMTQTFGLDGGGSIAADESGNVYVAWHGKQAGAPDGEDGRRVWIARSEDNGAHFSAETASNLDPTGACGCCGLSIFADENGDVYGLYRTAHENVHRDIVLLLSTDHGSTFRNRMVDPWKIAACPMSSMAFAQGRGTVEIAWQTKTEVYYAAVRPGTLEVSAPVAAPGSGTLRKYPALAVNSQGQTLLAWTDGTTWGKGGLLEWRVFDRQGTPVGERGAIPDLPAWTFGAAFARPDGSFAVLY